MSHQYAPNVLSNLPREVPLKVPQDNPWVPHPWMNVVPPIAQPKDPVVLPSHYARFKIEPVHFICENKLDFFQGNVVKYVCRHDAKNGIEDLKKARRYIDMYIKYLQGDTNWWGPDAP